LLSNAKYVIIFAFDRTANAAYLEGDRNMGIGWTSGAGTDGGTIYHVPIKGTDQRGDIDSGKFTDDLCSYIFYAGCISVFAGRGRGKLGAKTSFKGTAEEYAKESVRIFLEQVEGGYADKTKRTGVGGKAKAKGEEAKVKAEMKRIARKDGDNVLKNNGYVLSRVSTETKNKVAEALIAQDPEKYKKAALASLAAAAEAKSEKDDKAVLAALGFEVKEDEKLVAKANERKAKAKKPKAETSQARTAVPPPAVRGSVRGPLRPGLRPQ
jgi:hypothetical protein